MKTNLAGVLLCVAVLLPSVAAAGPIIRSGESISVDASQVLKGDFYGLAPTVTISGAGENDAYIAGGTVTINAPIAEDLSVLGGAVQVHGDIGDDLRLIGGEVTLARVVKGDVVVLGGTLTILSTASVEGSVLFLGGELTIEGNVIGEIHGAADRVRINAEIGGDILVAAQSSFALGDKAKILGNLTYESNNDIARAQGAQVKGEIRKMETPIETDSGLMKLYVLELCILLFTALSLFLIARHRVQTVTMDAASNLGRSGLIGLGVFLILPFIGGVLLVSVLGVLVGLMLLALYAALLLISVALGGILTGYYIQKLLTRKSAITFSVVVMGVVIFSALILIPFIGGLVMFAAIIVMLGSLSQAIYRGVQP